MANPFEVDVVNPLQALLIGQQSYNTGIENNKRAAKERAINEASQLAASGDRAGALAKLLGIGDYQGAGLMNTMDQNAWTRQHTEARDKVADAHQKFMEGIALRSANRADDKTPAGFEKDPGGGYRPILGGPSDPEYLRRKAAAVAQTEAPTGFERDPNGGLRPIAGGPADPAYLRQKGDRQNAPSGYLWNDPNDPSKGLTAIPGGPGEKVDAEVAGRLGLARSFLGQLPEIKRRVAEGGITGPIDAGQAYFGMGSPGEIRRQMDSGAEALLRMLTGAGMNKEEAAQYVRRYQFSPTDKAETVLSKLNQLERELNSVGETVGKGRGGWTPPGAKPSGQGNGADAMLQHARDAIAQGAPRAAVIQRLQQAGIDPSGL